MAERIFFISPLSEEEETKFPYDRQGNTIAMAYYDKQGNTIESSHHEQPKENTTTENRIIIIYEAPKPKVITEQAPAPEAIPTVPTSEETLPTNLYQEPEIYKTSLTQPNESYSEMIKNIYGEEPAYRQLLNSIYKEPPAYWQLLNHIYGEQPTAQPQTEANQLTSIRNELATITTTPGAQTREIQAAA